MYRMRMPVIKRPLEGIKVLEVAGLAPAPYCGLILADFGADVVRIDRTASSGGLNITDRQTRGKRSVAINFKSKEGIATFHKMIEKADVLLEPFRPGVAERLGFGPSEALKRNPRLVYARLTGWGQTGPYANMAGHDINYIAISGALSLIGRKNEAPMFPVNLLGDFAGGGLLCALGITMALLERNKSGQGQVVDAAMIEGAAYLNAAICGLIGQGLWKLERGTNLLDSGAPFYEVYKTKDGQYMSVGALEPQFYSELLKGLQLDAASLPSQMDEGRWPELREIFTKKFASKTREEWCKIFDGTDACVAPVLNLNEVTSHPHAAARNLYTKDQDGNVMPSPAPKLSRTPAVASTGPYIMPGQHTLQVLAEYGFTDQEAKELLAKGAIATDSPHSAL